MKMIKKDVLIEDLVVDYPESIKYLMDQGIHCMVCGEPIWGTFEQVARDKGFSDEAIDHMVDELGKMARESDK